MGATGGGVRRSPPAQKVRGQRKRTGTELRRRGGGDGSRRKIFAVFTSERRTRTSVWCKTGDTLVALVVTSAVTNNQQPGLLHSSDIACRQH